MSQSLKNQNEKRQVNRILYRQALNLLNRNDKIKFGAVVVIQIFLGALDLLGIALVGLLGSLAIRGIQSSPDSGRIGTFLESVHLTHLTLYQQTSLLALLASIVLITRTILSVVLTRKILHFLSYRSAVISQTLTSKFLNTNLMTVNRRGRQERVFALTEGLTHIMIGVIGSSVNIITDLVLLLMLTLGLFVVDYQVALLAFTLFASIGYLLYRNLHIKAGILGRRNSQLIIQSNQKVNEVLGTFRESIVRNTKYNYMIEIGEVRKQLSSTVAELAFMPNVTKYTLEASVVLGAVVLSATQFILKDAVHAVATLGIFMAAGTRIAPALLRVQQSFLQIRTSLGAAEPTLSLEREIHAIPELQAPIKFNTNNREDFHANISLSNVTFSYSSEKIILKDINLRINAGEKVALVGPSGSGKSTLIDLMVGALSPNSGLIKISNLDPIEVSKKWPGVLAYVPQEVAVVNASIRDNIMMGLDPDLISEEDLWNALRLSNLESDVRQMPHQMDSFVGDGGSNLSGGQKQRLGIARAILTKPEIIFLDEATSSLDASTEDLITKELDKKRGKTSLVIIAHRLSTVKDADTIVYLNQGKIEAVGSFSDVKREIPEFQHQAMLMGL